MNIGQSEERSFWKSDNQRKDNFENRTIRGKIILKIGQSEENYLADWTIRGKSVSKNGQSEGNEFEHRIWPLPYLPPKKYI